MRQILKKLKTGDIVKIDPNFPFIDRSMFESDVCIIDKMLDDAGVVTVCGQQWNKTFSVDAFDLIIEESEQV